MEKIAAHAKIKPNYLLVGENTEPWLEYSRLENIIADHGGMHNSARFYIKYYRLILQEKYNFCCLFL